MKEIGNFFDKFRNKALAQIQTHALVVEIIKKHTKISVEEKNIFISNGTLTIKASQAFKNEIYIKKQAIMKELSQRLQGTRISDIK